MTDDDKKLCEELRDAAALPNGLYATAAQAIERLSSEKESFYADYRMACDKDTKRLEEELDNQDQVMERIRGIMSAVAVALKGPPPELTMHDWSDLGEVAKAKMEELAALKKAQGEPVATFAGVRDTPAGTREFWGYLWGKQVPDKGSKLYLHPPVVSDAKDAARLDWLQSNCRADPMMDGQHKWWPTNFNKCLTGPSLRAAIDKAMEGK